MTSYSGSKQIDYDAIRLHVLQQAHVFAIVSLTTCPSQILYKQQIPLSRFCMGLDGTGWNLCLGAREDPVIHTHMTGKLPDVT